MQRMVDDWEPIIFNTTLYRDSGNMLSHNVHSSLQAFALISSMKIISRVLIFKMQLLGLFR